MMEKLTFKEMMKKYPMSCKCCGKLLDWRIESFVKGELNKITDVDGERLRGFYCGDCYTESLAYLMNDRFVENYNGATIFCKNGNYSPYWECPYYFKTLEECKTRIDAKNIAIMPWGVVGIG